MKTRRRMRSQVWTRTVRVLGLAPWLLLALGASGAIYEWGGAGGRGMRQLKEKHPKEAAQSF
ncbi:MAG TPA: hypothetical protein VJX91_04990, partial [Candidatus Eisenbacteria bacterium]|nr:hypothetical protein [Candidatus Eisenbacteria bacterium]